MRAALFAVIAVIAIVILVLEIKKPRFSKEIILQLFRRMRTQQ